MYTYLLHRKTIHPSAKKKSIKNTKNSTISLGTHPPEHRSSTIRLLT